MLLTGGKMYRRSHISRHAARVVSAIVLLFTLCPFALAGTGAIGLQSPANASAASGIVRKVFGTNKASHKRTPTPTATPQPTSTPTPTPTPTATVAPTPTAGATPITTTLVIYGQNGTTYSGLRISTTSGDCIDIINSTNVTIKNSNIGPCGTNNSLSAGNGIYISGGSGNNIYDNYIHVETLASGCCDTHDGILIGSGSTNDTVQGNVIAYGETNVETQSAGNVTITGNFLLNPRGPFPRGQQVQAALSTNITVSGNYTLGSLDTATYSYPEQIEDSISFWCDGSHTCTGYTVEGNYVTGGHSTSGCGINCDQNVQSCSFLDNVLYNTAQCGINISDGTNQLVSGNKILEDENPMVAGGDTALVVWNEYPTYACGPVQVRNNISTFVRTDGYASGYWNGGGCEPVTCDGSNPNVDSCNIFDYGSGRDAYNLLIADPAVTNPPLVPPGPKNCVAKSPYSTQTSLPACQ